MKPNPKTSYRQSQGTCPLSMIVAYSAILAHSTRWDPGWLLAHIEAHKGICSSRCTAVLVANGSRVSTHPKGRSISCGMEKALKPSYDGFFLKPNLIQSEKHRNEENKECILLSELTTLTWLRRASSRRWYAGHARCCLNLVGVPTMPLRASAMNWACCN